VRELGQRGRAGHHVLDRLAGQVLGAAGRDLHDPVAARVGETLQRGVQRLRRGDVDRGNAKPCCFAVSSICA
jgi:hypothetical protein